MEPEVPSEEAQQVSEFHSKYDLNEEDAILSSLDSQLAPFAISALTAFRFYHLLGICPSSFKFNHVSQKFEHLRGSWWRTAISLLLGTVIVLRYYGDSKLHEKQIQNVAILAMHKILRVCYVFFLLSFLRAFLLHGQLFKELLDALQNGYKVNLQIGCKFPSFWKVRLASTCLMICCIGIALWATVSFVAARVDTAGDAELYSFFASAGDSELNVLNYFIGQLGNSTSSAILLDEPIKVAIGAAGCLIQLWGSFCWSGAIYMNTLWGLVFWQLLRQFFEIVSKNSARNTLDDIRHFHVITKILVKYNEAYGCSILGIVSSSTVHFSMRFFQILKENGGSHDWIRILVVFSWFGLMMISCAHAHKTACDIVQVMKKQFEDVRTKKEENCIETAQGMMLILHEVQTNSIGFQGCGFFTCTYSFIGTVLSAIATYTIIVLEFQN